MGGKVLNAYLPPVGPAITAYGPVDYTHKDVTDLWGAQAELDAILPLHHDTYYKTDHDRVTAHIGTSNGRVFLHRKDTDPWEVPHGMTAKQTMRLLDKLASLLHCRALHYSPQTRGLEMLRYMATPQAERPAERHPLADHIGDTSKERVYSGSAFDRELPPSWDQRDPAVTPNFTKRLYDRSQVGWLLHKYDYRASWPAAAKTATMGFGPCLHHPRFDPRVAALWPVQLAKPFPVTNRPIMFSGYYDTAIVRAALDNGQAITIAPGWGWAYNGTPMRQWVERLFSARDKAHGEGRTRAEGDYLVAAIKMIYTRAQGALDSYRQSRPWAFQPHWYYALRAESARRMWKAYTNGPMHAYHVGMHTDTLFALTPKEISPYEVFPFASVNAWNPGTLRYEGSAPLTREMYDMLGGPGSELSDLLRRRNCLEQWEVER